MFKRFQSPKAPPPVPLIEEDLKCPQCGFDHAGWAFEPGYARLCVQCGSALDPSEDPECVEEENAEETGFFSRIFHGRLTGKQEKPAPGDDSEAPGTKHPIPHDRPPDPEAARMGACKREGRLLAAQGRYEKAAEMFQKVVAFEPNDVESWGELGRIHYQGTKDLAKSIECSRKALEIDGDLVRVRCNLCLALLFDGQFEPARKGFLEVIRAVRNSRDSDREFQENCRALLQDCLGDLYRAKKKASGELLAHIRECIELLELERIYFQ